MIDTRDDHALWARLPVRGTDSWGRGGYDAPRGDELHHAIDFACPPGAEIGAIVAGIVDRFGYCYEDDLHWRYIAVRDRRGWEWRYLYVVPVPGLKPRMRVARHQVIGVAQEITRRYTGITNHVHVDVTNSEGDRIDWRTVEGMAP